MARLRRSDLAGAGIVRRRRGRGFSYTWSTGEAVTDPEVLHRIATLAIPPAWRDVWICPWPHGHLQAVGTDDAGRRQYRYHDDWRKRRDQEKFERILDFGRALPSLRSTVEADLAAAGLGRRRVLATAVRLLDIGFFRVGGEQYADEHGTFGVATLRKDHVSVRRGHLVFHYLAKGSIARDLVVTDPDVRDVVCALRRRRSGGDDLLAWKEGRQWIDVTSAHVNAYIKEEGGAQFSAKDFRTWSATVLAAAVLAGKDTPGRSSRERQRAVTATVKEVASYLGNTPAVCRSSYIDPRILDRFALGDTIGRALQTIGETGLNPTAQRRVEEAVIDLLSEVAKAAA